MSGRRIILKDGTTYEGSNCGYSSGFLWCYIEGHTLGETAAVFLDPAKTARIVYEYGEMQDVYEGFTDVKIMQSRESGCDICLQKPNSMEG